MAQLQRTSIQVTTSDIPGQIHELLNVGWRVESIHPVGDLWALVVLVCDDPDANATPTGIRVEIGSAWHLQTVLEKLSAEGWRMIGTHVVSDKRHQHVGEVLGTTIAAFLQR